MHARLETQNDVLIVHFEGYIEVGTAEVFRAAASRNFVGRKLVFDFAKLSFVGSSGILPFVSVLEEISRKQKLKFVNLGTDFSRVLSSSEIVGAEVYPSAALAALSYSQIVISSSLLVSNPSPQSSLPQALPPDLDDAL